MNIGHQWMHLTMSLTLQTWQGLYSKRSVVFSSSKNSCMTNDKLVSNPSYRDSLWFYLAKPGQTLQQGQVQEIQARFSQVLALQFVLLERRALCGCGTSGTTAGGFAGYQPRYKKQCGTCIECDPVETCMPVASGCTASSER